MHFLRAVPALVITAVSIFKEMVGVVSLDETMTKEKR